MTSTPRAPRKAPRQPAKPGAAAPAWFDPRAPYLVPVLLGACVRLYLLRTIPFANEDAYITFRYAENWAHGLGPVYNAGERVFGFSSPLWTAWLALGGLVLPSVASFARLSGLLLDLAALLLAARMLETERGRFAAWAFAFFFAVCPVFAASAILGMETSLFLFLLVAAAGAIGSGSRGAGVLLGLLALVRPEAVLVAAIVGLGARSRDRGIALAIFGAGVAALTLYFGSPIPQSALAKAAVYGTPGPLSGLAWIEGLVPILVSGRWPATAEGTNLFPLSLVAAPAVACALAAFWRERRRPTPSLLVGVAGLAVLAGYFAFGVPFFYWYLVVPAAAWFWTAAIGLGSISRHRALLVALALYVVSDAILLQNLYVERVRQEVISFYQTGMALRSVSGGQGTVFTEPLGHIGYVTHMWVYDEVGLVAPRVARRRAAGPGWYAETIAAQRPDWLVVRKGFFDENLAFAGGAPPFGSDADRLTVIAAYEPVAYRVPGVETGLEIWHRRGAAPAPGAPATP